jgi:hypothetical protein
LFHLLLEAASARVTRDLPLQPLVRRAYSHGEMLKAANSFKSGTGSLPGHISAVFSGTIPLELRQVANTFVALQEARHQADYDLQSTFTRADTQALIASAGQAFVDWETSWRILLQTLFSIFSYPPCCCGIAGGNDLNVVLQHRLTS